MAATYEPIASTTLASNAADFTFTSVPSTFTDLVVVVSARTTSSTVYDDLCMQFNGDTGTNYSRTYMNGNGSVAASGRTSNNANFFFWYSTGTNMAANVYPMSIVHLMNYSNTNVYKTGLINMATPDAVAHRQVGLWRSTAAISSIKIYPIVGGSNIEAGSTLSLYGIKAA